MFQKHFLINHLTVRENILLPERKRGARKRLEEITTALGLNKLLKRFPYELSLGQSQDGGCGKSIDSKSEKVVFADELTASLDDENGSRVIELLKSYCSKSGATLIFVSHSSEIIGDFRRRLRVENGQVYEVGVNA